MPLWQFDLTIILLGGKKPDNTMNTNETINFTSNLIISVQLYFNERFSSFETNLPLI